jgi:hypothetical protein
MKCKNARGGRGARFKQGSGATSHVGAGRPEVANNAIVTRSFQRPPAPPGDRRACGKLARSAPPARIALLEIRQPNYYPPRPPRAERGAASLPTTRLGVEWIEANYRSAGRAGGAARARAVLGAAAGDAAARRRKRRARKLLRRGANDTLEASPATAPAELARGAPLVRVSTITMLP